METSFQIKDVTLREDNCAVRNPNSALVLSTLHSLAVSVLKRMAGKDPVKRLVDQFRETPLKLLKSMVTLK